MRIAIPVMGKDLDSLLDPRFGRAQGYLIIDVEKEDHQFIPNPAAGSPRGAGVAAAQIIANQKVEAVVAGFIGPNAFQALDSAGIAVYQASAALSARKIVEKLKAGQLSQISAPTGPPKGRGFGLGQRMGPPGRGRRGQGGPP